MAEPQAATRLATEDREDIDDLLAAYALSLDTDDIDSAAALFAEDGEFDTYGRVFAGRDRIRRMFAAAPKGLHLIGRSTATSRPGGADVRMQLAFFPADEAPRRLAIYDIHVVRAGDGWAIQCMKVRFLTSEGILASEP